MNIKKPKLTEKGGIYFSCSTSYGNLGDLIINKMLVDELCKYRTVYVDTYNISKKFVLPLLENKNTVDCYEKYNISFKGGYWMILKTILFIWFNHITCVIPSPGPYSPEISPIHRRLKNSFIEWAYKIFGTKTFHIGKCVSSLELENIPFLNKLVDEYYLRSFESVKYIRKTNDRAKIEYIPDLCYLLNQECLTFSKNKIALFDFRLIEGQTREIIRWCKDTIIKLSSQGFHSIFYYQVEGDDVVVEQLYNSTKGLNCSFKKEMIWYENLSFYEDKMFIFSNRLHSLLIGAAYQVYPVCYYDETPSTLKLKHVFNSSLKDISIFSTDLPSDLDFGDFYRHNISKLNNQYSANTTICKQTIECIMRTNNLFINE